MMNSQIHSNVAWLCNRINMVNMECQWKKKVDTVHDSQDPSKPKNQGLPDGRNVEG